MKKELGSAFFILLVLSMLLFATSCKKKHTEPDPVNSTTSVITPTSGELSIYTMQYCPSYNDVYLANAVVNLYLTKSDYINNYIAKSFNTDEFGNSNNKGLKPQVYYYKVIGNINTGNCTKNGATIASTLQVTAGINNSYTITLQ